MTAPTKPVRPCVTCGERCSSQLEHPPEEGDDLTEWDAEGKCWRYCSACDPGLREQAEAIEWRGRGRHAGLDAWAIWHASSVSRDLPTEDRTKPPPGCKVEVMVPGSTWFVGRNPGGSPTPAGPDPDRCIAALWEQHDRQRAAPVDSGPATDSEDELASLRAEVERLEAQVVALQGSPPVSVDLAELGERVLAATNCQAERDSLRAEVERLRAKVEFTEGVCERFASGRGGMLDRLQAEVDRLRAETLTLTKRADDSRTAYLAEVDRRRAAEDEAERLRIKADYHDSAVGMLCRDFLCSPAKGHAVDAALVAASRYNDARAEVERLTAALGDANERAARLGQDLGGCSNALARVAAAGAPEVERLRAELAEVQALSETRRNDWSRERDARQIVDRELDEAVADAERERDRADQAEWDRDKARQAHAAAVAALTSSGDWHSHAVAMEAERDAALKRAEKAERERDGMEAEADRMETGWSKCIEERDEARSELAKLRAGIRELAELATAGSLAGLGGASYRAGISDGIGRVVDLLDDEPEPDAAGLLHDSVHRDPGRGRAVRIAKVRRVVWERKPIAHEWTYTRMVDWALERGYTVSPHVPGYGCPATRPRGAQ